MSEFWKILSLGKSDASESVVEKYSSDLLEFELLEDFSDLYLDKHDLEHLKDFENLIKQ